MNRLASIRLALAMLALAAAALAARAQEEPRRYKEFTIEPGYEKILKERFQANEKFGPFKDLVRDVLAHPDKLPLDAGRFKDMKLEDEKLKEMVRDWMAHDPKLQESLREWIKRNPADGKQPDAKKMQAELKELVDDAVKKAAEPAMPAPAPLGPKPLEPVRPKDDQLAKWAERALKQTEHGRLGEWLRNSPAWKRAFDDLHGTVNDPDAPHWKLDGWRADMLDPDGGFWRVGQEVLHDLRGMAKPDLNPFDWGVEPPGVGEPGTPQMGGPASFGGAALGKVAIWILVIVLCALIGGRLLRWRARAGASALRTGLGPWPVRPEAVASRADLVQAFDYLAIGTLGPNAAPWNHHAVANRWREAYPARADSAAALETLYEQARYTAGPDALTDRERDLARRSLALIAEAL